MICVIFTMYRIVAEFEQFSAKAVKVPDDSREMMSLISYMEDAKTVLVAEQWQAVQASLSRLVYLMDVHTFTAEDMELNQVTLKWPEKLGQIFEQNEQMVEASKVSETKYIESRCTLSLSHIVNST